MQERVFIVKLLFRRYKSIQAVEEHLKDIFVDNIGQGITLMTIHRSKGLENKRIFLLKMDELIPSKYARTVDELRAESCLEYVAITRSQGELIYIS